MKIHISTFGFLVHYQKDKGLLNLGEGIPEKQSTPLREHQDCGEEQYLLHSLYLLTTHIE